jgi:hypothetical protein
MSSKIVMISGCTDCRLAPILYERGASKPVQWPPLFWIPTPKVLENAYHLTTCMRILLKERRMSQIPQLSTSFQPKATPLAFCSRLNLITSVCKSDVLLVQKQPPRPSTKIKLKETTENAVKETSKELHDDQWWQCVCAFLHHESISLLPSPILWTQCSLLLDNRQSEEWSLW